MKFDVDSMEIITVITKLYCMSGRIPCLCSEIIPELVKLGLLEHVDLD